MSVNPKGEQGLSEDAVQRTIQRRLDYWQGEALVLSATPHCLRRQCQLASCHPKRGDVT